MHHSACQQKSRPEDRRRNVAPQMLARGIAFVAFAALLAWGGWYWGRHEPFTLRVAGGSMAPTLLGQHFLGVCQTCQRDAIAMDATPHKSPPADAKCAFCGDTLVFHDPHVYPGDLVFGITRGHHHQLSSGQMVAIVADSDDTSPLRVKRIAGVAGQTIDVTEGQLTVDGKRLDDQWVDLPTKQLARLLVHEASQTQHDKLAPRWLVPWKTDHDWRHDMNGWQFQSSAPSSWLVYHHCNVYQQGRESAILDDYQYNATLIRQLEPVDRLVLTAGLTVNQPCRVDVRYWLPSRKGWSSDQEPHAAMCQQTILVDPRKHRSSMATTNESLAWFSLESSTTAAIGESQFPANRVATQEEPEPVVSSMMPVAIRVRPLDQHRSGSELQVQIQNLKLWKAVPYRLRRSDDSSLYPLKLRPDEVFVVGDNLPTSIDSRNHGPIARSQIVGVIKLPE